MKAIIISQPKSGTYLCANLLQEFGLQFDGYHLSEFQYQKYNLKDLKDSVKNLKKYTIKDPLDKSLKLINDNSFAVSHLPFSTNSKLTDFKKIIVSRNREDALDSWDRFGELRKVIDSSKVATLQEEHYNNMLMWNTVLNTFHITFNDMINKNTTCIDSLQNFLFDRVKVNSLYAIENALAKPSLTKSSLR